MDLLTRRLASIAYARRHRGRGQSGHARTKRTTAAPPGPRAATMAAPPKAENMAEPALPTPQDVDAMSLEQLREALTRLGEDYDGRHGRAKLAVQLKAVLAADGYGD